MREIQILVSFSIFRSKFLNSTPRIPFAYIRNNKVRVSAVAQANHLPSSVSITYGADWCPVCFTFNAALCLCSGNTAEGGSVLGTLHPRGCYLFFKVREWEIKRERQRDPLSVASLFRWSRLKQGSRSFCQVSHVGSRDPNIWTTFCCFFKPIGRELDVKCAHMGYWHFRQQLYLLGHNVSPSA